MEKIYLMLCFQQNHLSIDSINRSRKLQKNILQKFSIVTIVFLYIFCLKLQSDGSKRAVMAEINLTINKNFPICVKILAEFSIRDWHIQN